jgi:hypothetical protein
MISTNREWLHWVDTCPWHPGVSTVRYPIPQRTFKYVATVQSVTDETCQLRTLVPRSLLHIDQFSAHQRRLGRLKRYALLGREGSDNWNGVMA